MTICLRVSGRVRNVIYVSVIFIYSYACVSMWLSAHVLSVSPWPLTDSCAISGKNAILQEIR